MVFHGRHFVQLRVLRKWQVIEVIEVSGLAFCSFFRDFNGRPKSDQILGSSGHGIRLWFSLVGVFVGCPFLRPRGPIEVIEMIEVIEVIRWAAGRRYVAQGLRWGGRVEAILDSWCFGHGGGMGFTYGLAVFLKVPILVFPIRPHFKILAFRF